MKSLDALRDELCDLFKKQFPPVETPESHVPCNEPSLKKIVDDVQTVLAKIRRLNEEKR